MNICAGVSECVFASPSVCVCARTHDSESFSVSPRRLGLLEPRGGRGQLAALGSHAARALPGHSSGRATPRALELTSGGYHGQNNTTRACARCPFSVLGFSGNIGVFECYFCMSSMLQYPFAGFTVIKKKERHQSASLQEELAQCSPVRTSLKTLKSNFVMKKY